MTDTQQRIDELVKTNDVVLFMKGNASFPQCGFSGRAIQILKACGVDAKTRKTVNVLEDAEIRAGIKDYSQWPTIPQVRAGRSPFCCRRPQQLLHEGPPHAGPPPRCCDPRHSSSMPPSTSQCAQTAKRRLRM